MTCGPRACPPLSCGKDQSPFIPDGDCCPVCAHNGGTVSCIHACSKLFIHAQLVVCESDCFSLPPFLVLIRHCIYFMEKIVIMCLELYGPVENKIFLFITYHISYL